MSQNIKEEITSFNSERSDSNDSQNINGSIKDKQSSLEDEEEYNKEEIIELFHEFGQMKKKKKNVSFANDKKLVTIIDVESYKKYNTPLLIGKINIMKYEINKKGNVNKKRKDIPNNINNDYLNKEGNSGKSCSIF